MDYRSSIADDEHPAGASPWGSSPPVSPHRNGSSFPYDVAAQDTSNGFAQQISEGNPFQRPDTASSAASTTEYDQSEPSSQSASHDPATEQEHAGTSQQHSHTHQQPQTHDHHQQQQQQQSNRRSTGPQYKLQAKITGLERTGRKDPILRFDVHVGLPTEPAMMHKLCSQY